MAQRCKKKHLVTKIAMSKDLEIGKNAVVQKKFILFFLLLKISVSNCSPVSFSVVENILIGPEFIESF